MTKNFQLCKVQTVGDIYTKFTSSLSGIYEPNEAEQITILAFENVMGYRRMEISQHKNDTVNESGIKKFDAIITELLSGKPIQYVLGNAWFCDMNLFVNENVLIPRRETEELVEWISKDITNAEIRPLVILDICTGSGCIALALKKKFPHTRIVAIDISEKALDVARMNAQKQWLDVEFLKMDALNLDIDIQPDIIVSNPPYVLNYEMVKMHNRVKEFEPSIALFVPDDDALLFYRQIAGWASKNLNPKGNIYFEINEMMGESISELHSQLGFGKIEIRKDLQGKDRMFRAGIR